MKPNTRVEAGKQNGTASREDSPSMTEDKTSQPAMDEERLPFRVGIVRNEDELEKAVSIRHEAYERHIPTVAALLEKAEDYDNEPGSAVLLAQSKLDGSPLGTMRIQTNRYRKLALEQSVTLPPWLQGRSQAEATRLGVAHSSMGPMVKTALFKAYYHYCLREQIEWLVIAARSPMDEQYESLLMKDVFPGGEFTPMLHAGNIPHRVLALRVDRVEPEWRQARHPLYGFFFHTHHADIDLHDKEAPAPDEEGCPASTNAN
ncbi:MAG: hypothetical protein FD157_498 [Rhodocyclaceae bacterium]|nr:MAG: hypothetical protein FD157_498 [Rhodocyclaceae bacterium]TND00488.1 MAG: hypothetical protein FD118_3078 [Rhodocyclaceae bacterium]